MTRLPAALLLVALLAGACAGTAPDATEVNGIGGISIGEEHGCLIERQYGVDGNGPERSVIWCWGDGVNGELGDGTGAPRPYYGGGRLDVSGEIKLPSMSGGAVQVVGIENAVSVTVVSNDTTCAVAGDTGLYCWGESRPIGLDRSVWTSMASTAGEAGKNRRTPVKMMDGVAVFAVAGIANPTPDANYACITHAYLADTGVYCWGAGLGTRGVNGASEWIDTPTLIEGLPDGVRANTLALAKNRACALLEDNSVWCWGSDEAPARIDNRSYRSIDAAAERICGVSFDNTVYCWGQGFTQWFGGTGSQNGLYQPAELDNFGLIAPDEPIAVGNEHVCLSYHHGAYCYGANDRGQIGDGGSRARDRLVDRTAVRGLAYPNWDAKIRAAMPVTLRGETDHFTISAMSANENGACAVVYERAVACWGNVPPVRLGDPGDVVYETPMVLTFNR